MTEENLIQADSVLKSYLFLKQHSIKTLFDDAKSILDKFQVAKQHEVISNEQSSFLFNPLKFFPISENMHSFLLAKLLNPNAEHGQGNLFLGKFLDIIGIEWSQKDKWIVTAEMGRIDIRMKRKNPHSVIVIENKSNNACDQNCQLYRYWLTEMFLPNKEKHYAYTLLNRKQYRLIYLAPNQNKYPDATSLLKPDRALSEDFLLPNKLEPEHVMVLTFEKHIVEWLEKCLPDLENNKRMREFVCQYIELWRN